MKIKTSLYVRNNLKHFSLEEGKFCDYLAGEYDDKKQLFAFSFKNYPAQFLAAIIHNQNLSLLKGVEYMTTSDVQYFFGWRKFNVENWHSKEKMRLKKLWLSTPKCFVVHEKAHLMTLESIEITFPVVLPKEETCRSCLIFGQCEGGKKYREG